MVAMPPVDDVGRIVRGTVRGGRGVARGASSASRWVGRNVGTARNIGGAGNVGMMRLPDLHAASGAGGTVAGAVAALLGALALAFGPQWPLRLSTVAFLIGAVVALNLPPKADADPPEVLPKAFHLPWRHRVPRADGSLGDRILHGRLVIAALVGSAGLRMLYGFLLLFLAFAIRENGLDGSVLGGKAGPVIQITLVGGAFGLGTFIATAIGTGLHIPRPIRLQAIGVLLVALAGIWATLRFSLASIVLLCLATAIASGLAKLAVDASIQERIPEQIRASAFAHAETLLMLAWVAGAAIGLIPFVNARVGLGITALAVLVATVRSVAATWRLRSEFLRGAPAAELGAGLNGTLLRP